MFGHLVFRLPRLVSDKCVCVLCFLAYVGSYESVMVRDAKFAIYARSLVICACLGSPGASFSDDNERFDLPNQLSRAEGDESGSSHA